MWDKGENIRSGPGFWSARENIGGLRGSGIGNSGAFLVIMPKGINQLGLDERKRVYRISGEILAVERTQKEILSPTRI
jgi:hypothetical protein